MQNFVQIKTRKQMNTFKIISDSEAKTKEIAKKISTLFKKGDVILLDGGLGTGKTHFVQGFAEGHNYNHEVTSPTFNIANFYKADNITLLHIDLYRIEDYDEFSDLGITEYFDDTIVLIEWGEKFAEYFDDYFSIFIEHVEGKNNSRKLTFSTNNDKYVSKFEAIKNIIL